MCRRVIQRSSKNSILSDKEPFKIVLQNIYFHVLICGAVFAWAKMLGQFTSFGFDSDI